MVVGPSGRRTDEPRRARARYGRARRQGAGYLVTWVYPSPGNVSISLFCMPQRVCVDRMRSCSAVNRSVGPTFYSHMRSRSKMTSSVSDNSSRASPSFRSAVVPSPATRLPSIANSSLENSGSRPWPRTACGASAIATLSSSF